LALEKPTPRDRTKGTVTGPVVTPAESHAMFVKFSDEKTVKVQAIEYLIRIKKITFTPNKILDEPVTVEALGCQCRANSSTPPDSHISHFT
jgi:hypothetical protein